MKTLQLFIGTLLSLGLFHLAHAKVTNLPEQVHLSLGTDETEMVVTWATYLALSDVAHVEYGSSATDLKSIAKAEVSHFKDDLAEIYTYRALLTGLKPGSKYYYRVGSAASGMTAVFHFRSLPSGSSWNPRLAIYGDLGYQNEVSIPFLTKEVHDLDMYDVVFHIGDIAYDLHSKDGERGNKFMRSIETVSSQVPYMTCPGNHEKHHNFSHYDARFSMIGDRAHPNHNAPLNTRLNNHFYSMDIGPAHVILYSTEFYYFTEYGWDQIERQFQWLEEDLKRANQNRAQRPWIIVMAHRPLYCLKGGNDDNDPKECNHQDMERPLIRQGIHMHDDVHAPLRFGLEQLFFKYGVDIQFYGHEHFYGRLLPLYNNTIMSGTRSANAYDNPTGPVHIVTGSAGNKEEHPIFNPTLKNWVAHHHLDYGYTRLTFKDRQHIVLEQTSDDKNGAVVDKIDIIKHTDQPLWMP